jgi:hypothetical protein
MWPSLFLFSRFLLAVTSLSVLVSMTISYLFDTLGAMVTD